MSIAEVQNLNKEALDDIKAGRLSEGWNKLTTAQSILESLSSSNQIIDQKQFTSVLNNFGCYFRATGDPKKALECLIDVVKIESNSLNKDNFSLASTYLNLSAVYYDMKRFLYAIKCAYRALTLLMSVKESNTEIQNHIIICNITLSSVNYALKRYEDALFYAQMAQQLEQHRSQPNQHLLSELQLKLSTIQGFQRGRELSTDKRFRKIRSHSDYTRQDNFLPEISTLLPTVKIKRSPKMKLQDNKSPYSDKMPIVRQLLKNQKMDSSK